MPVFLKGIPQEFLDGLHNFIRELQIRVITLCNATCHLIIFWLKTVTSKIKSVTVAKYSP